jgi:transcriptional regulator with XRE-family HTH domain
MGATQMADPAALRRRLRTELRRARDDAQKTQRDVAEALFWSPSKVIRIESGQTGVSVTDLKALLDFYGVRDDAKVAELVEMARRSRKQRWSQYRDVVTAEVAMYYGYEASASIVRQFEPLLIPGLLQTPTYMRALLDGVFQEDERTIERRVEARVERQKLLDREDVRELIFIVDEAAVRHVVGGPQAMAEQLEHITALADRPDVTFRVIPFSVGGYIGLRGPFSLLQFPGQDDADVVYLEGLESAFFHDNDERTGQYRGIFEDLESKALSEEASIELLGSIVAGLQAEVSVPRRG